MGTLPDMYKLIRGLEEPRPQGAPRPSLLKSLRTVLWGFAGIRKGRDHAADSASITPLHVIAIGLSGVALFVAFLVVLVRHIAG